MDEFDPSSTFDVDAPDFDWDESVPEPATQAPSPEDPPMYEPDSPPAGDASQWAPYDNTAFIPPQDDFDPQPQGVSAPPQGREYDMYRQQPTWQHASLRGIDRTQVNLGGLLQGLTAIAASSGLGYALTGSPKVAAGAGLGMAGVLQLPSLLSGEFIRALVGAAAVAGAYFLLRDDLEGIEQLQSGEWHPNDADDFDDDFDDDDDEDDDDSEDAEAGEPEGDPAKSSPWLDED